MRSLILSVTCLICSSVFAARPETVRPLQKIAQQRVDAMAALPRPFRGHLPVGKKYGTPWKLGARFEGTCWGPRGRDPKNLPTCRPHPRRGMRLVADAIAKGKFGVYRLRLWR